MPNETAPLLDKSPSVKRVKTQAQPQQISNANSGPPHGYSNAPPPHMPQDAQNPTAPAQSSFLPSYAGYGATAGSNSSEQMTAYAMAAAQYEAAAAASWAANTGAYPAHQAPGGYGSMPMYPPQGAPPPQMYGGGGYPYHQQQQQQQMQQQPSAYPQMAPGYPMHPQQQQQQSRAPRYNNGNEGSRRASSPSVEQQQQQPPAMQVHRRQEYPKAASSVEQYQQTLLMAAARTRSYSNDMGAPVGYATAPPPIINLKPSKTAASDSGAKSQAGIYIPSNANSSSGNGGLPNLDAIFSGEEPVGVNGKSEANKIVPPSTSKPPKVRARMVRTSSSNEISATAGAAATSSAKAPVQPRHRRASSDIPTSFRNNTGGLLPPMNASRKSLAFPPRSGISGNISGGNSVSSGSRPRAMSTSSIVRMHRRTDSSGNASVMSTATSPAGSIVSNIAKSQMFGGVCEETGQVQMHFPFEAVRLVMTKEDQVGDKVIGKLFIETGDDDSAVFDHYHQVAYDLEMQDMMDDGAPQWESMNDVAQGTKQKRGAPNSAALKANASGNHSATHKHHLSACVCQCQHCKACIGKDQLLPPPQYVLPIDESVYRRVLHEISEAQTMPCGLFFCGHHEDVAYPSIWIAVVIVAMVFATMVYVSVLTN